jgi:hypothetical protein
MSDLIFSREVLKLNKNHLPIGFFTPKDVFTALANYMVDRRQNYILDVKGNKMRKMLAYDITYEQIDDDLYDFSKLLNMRVVDWDEWITLPVRSYDLFVHTPNLVVRVPRVVVSLACEEMPKVRYNTSLKSVYNLYEGICQISKKRLTMKEASRDHVIPVSKGGENKLNNIILVDRCINSRMGNKYKHELGLPEIKPKTPKTMPVKDTLRNIKGVPEWEYWLKR